MSHRYDHEPFPRRPVNKATMDEPQEEFIEPYAATIDPELDPGGEWAYALHSVPSWSEQVAKEV